MSREPQRASEPAAKPFNAADEEQVAEREKNAKRREDARAAGLRYLLADPRGRAWMRHLLAEKLFTRVGKTRPAGIFTGNSTTFYNAALKEAGDILAAECATLCPAEFRLMEDEGDRNG